MNQLKYLSDEDELKKFPLTLKQFTEVGGIIWTARELDDDHLQNAIDMSNYHLAYTRPVPRGEKTKLEACVQEKMRRELRRNGGVDPSIGQDNVIKLRREIMDKAAKEDSKLEDLVVEVRTVSGDILGRTIFKPHRFSTGSTGFKATDRYQDRRDWSTKFQFSAQLVRVGSKPVEPNLGS